MIPPWVSLLVSAVTGGLMGAALNILYHRAQAKTAAKQVEQSGIEALAGELRRSRLLCDHNAALKQNATAPFIRFPNAVATEVSFGHRHSYPSLAPMQPSLEAYSLAATHLNQLIDLHHLLWSSHEAPVGISSGAPGRREELRFEVTDICSGQKRLEKFGPEGFLVWPTFIGALVAQLSDPAHST